MSAAPALAWQCEGPVARVHDGDTVTVRCPARKPVKVRVANIDAPELHQADGHQAREALVALTAQSSVRIDVVAVDRYERAVARLSVDGNDLGLRLVADGWAWCGKRPDAGCRGREREARQAQRGLWQRPDPQPPWQWRREHPRRD